ncbi:prsA [Symbiodinium natans]|uniref:Peptidyl-prolyl cis-trans isomerase C n=1 Tax=Symbiodinium natans TaxID=878477 RepID=A0A812JBE1_9DINO|nr:prsA [Symbiodinium natans]
MKPMRSDDFCLLWDDLFVPGELMVNKGQDHYFIPAFCSDEPFALEHIKVLWQLQAEDANSLEDAEDDAVLREGPLDGEQFCRALVPSVQCPEDFANVARSYSACPGTRADGGDLGEVERGQMHSAIEAALFDPELELGCPLGPIQTDAGFHLLMARKKSRGILSTTVSASHILVKPGRYQAPSCEVHMHLPNMVGEEADMTRTWRRWSFAHSLPPALSHLAEAQDEAEQLQLKRQALRGKPGLRLLFRWEGAFIFNVKGILSDIAGDMIGPIHLVDGSLGTEEARYLGELLTSDDARTTKTDKDGFDARMDWAETGWQESEGILDADSMCTVQILLRRVGETLEHARKRMSTVRLRIKPTRLAYVASEPGLRLGLSSPSSVQDRLATLVSLIDSGELLVKVDGGEEEILDPRPSTVVVASTVERPAGCPVLLLYDEENLVQAEVLAYMGRHLGSRHRVRYQSGGVPEELEVDLNEMNHSLLRFASLREFEEARIAYCKQVVEDGRYIEDAITGNRVDISEQIVRVQMEVRKLPDPDSIRHMAFDDLEWISDTSFHLGDRVWAQGREGTVEHLQKHGRYVVKFADGTSSPALPASSIKRARPIAGVQNSSFEQVRDISEMIPLLLHPSRVVQGRSHGAHSAQPVLIRAGPGTGKTWSMQQLLLLLAQELAGGEPGTSNAVKFRFVPLLIPIQKLARMLRTRPAGMEGETSSNLVLFFIRAEYPEGPTRNMLEQAFEMRSLIVMLDGIDEAANMKLAVEEFVTKTLVLMGVPLLVTSRPEGIRKRLYSRDFVIMNLQPLSGEQQQKIIEKQLQQNAFFKHLVAFSRARQAQEEAFRQSFPSRAEREALQQLPNSLEEVPPATEDIDHEVFAAVFFCLAVRLLASAQLDPSCLQLPQETDQLPTQDVQKRLSIHSRKLGMIKADFVCPTAASMMSLSHSLLAGFTAPVDGEPANLQVVRCRSFFQDPGPTRLRFLRYELRLRYQGASLTAQVQIHHSACLSSFRTMKMQDHFTYLRRNLQSEGACDDMLEARMLVFDDICRVPVLLSVLACAFAVDTQRLPENLFDLYVMGMLSTLERRVGKDRVQVTLEMLQAIAVANHTAKRRTFQAEDLRTALKEPGHLALWSQLLEEGTKRRLAWKKSRP